MPATYLPPSTKVFGYDIPSPDRLRELVQTAAASPDMEFVRMTARELQALAFSASVIRAGIGIPHPFERRWQAIDELAEVVREQIRTGKGADEAG